MQQTSRTKWWMGLGLIGIAVALYFLFFYGEKKPVHVRLVYKKNANYLIYFVAEEKGFFKEKGLQIDPQIVESTNLMVQALGTGQADFNPSNSVPALYAAELASPGTFKILYYMLMAKGHSNDAILVKKGSSITSISELKGKKIGGPPGLATVVLLKLILKNFMNPDEDIEIVELEPQLQLQALGSNQVDALFGIEPITTFGIEKGIAQILAKEPMEEYIMNPLPIAAGVVSKSFQENYPKELEKLINAMNKAIDFTRANEAESRKILAKYIGMSEQTANNLGITTFWKSNEVDTSFAQKLANIFLEERVLDKKLETAELLLQSKP